VQCSAVQWTMCVWGSRGAHLGKRASRFTALHQLLAVGMIAFHPHSNCVRALVRLAAGTALL
jgi:hypothetical protein